jgi:hypothetical protein
MHFSLSIRTRLSRRKRDDDSCASVYEKDRREGGGVEIDARNKSATIKMGTWEEEKRSQMKLESCSLKIFKFSRQALEC